MKRRVYALPLMALPSGILAQSVPVAAPGSGGSSILFAFLVFLALAAIGFWIWSLIDCLNNEPSTGNDKLIWVLVIVFLGVLGSLFYVGIRRPQR